MLNENMFINILKNNFDVLNKTFDNIDYNKLLNVPIKKEEKVYFDFSYQDFEKSEDYGFMFKEIPSINLDISDIVTLQIDSYEEKNIKVSLLPTDDNYNLPFIECYPDPSIVNDEYVICVYDKSRLDDDCTIYDPNVTTIIFYDNNDSEIFPFNKITMRGINYLKLENDFLQDIVEINQLLIHGDIKENKSAITLEYFNSIAQMSVIDIDPISIMPYTVLLFDADMIDFNSGLCLSCTNITDINISMLVTFENGDVESDPFYTTNDGLLRIYLNPTNTTESIKNIKIYIDDESSMENCEFILASKFRNAIEKRNDGLI